MKKYIIYISSFLAVSFLTYCFFPVITYKSNQEPNRIYLLDRNGQVITDKANKYGYRIIQDIDLNSQFVKDLLKIEDKHYYNHLGIDLASKLGAIKSNLLHGKIVSGGSTITEQFIKNKYFKENKRTYLQKSREAFLAMIFSVSYDKKHILENYLNNIYLGNNIYGIATASEVYFGKTNINNLNQEEITLLISLIHNPGVKSLEEKSFRQYFDKIKTKLGYTFNRTIYKLNKKENIDKFPFVTNNLNTLILPLLTKEGTEGWSVTIDSTLQQYAKYILNQTLDGLKDKNVTNGAIFAINPKTNEVLIYQGSRDYNSHKIDGQVDVIQSLRQPGSTMKPFLYLMALENGANPDDLLLDLNNQLSSFQEGKTYISNNYSLKEFGLVRFKKALGNSLNNASVRLAKELGLNKVYEFYKSYGFDLKEDAEYYGYSLVLGNPSIKLEDLVMSYSKLIPNSNSNIPILNSFPSAEEKEASNIESEQAKFLLYDILSNPDNRDISFGVNSILNTSIPQAVKTGTSSDFRDNVIVSYHPDFVIGIWIGNNDNSSMIGVTGITGAGYIWHNIIEKAIELGYIKNEKIELPNGLEESNYCLDEKCYRKELIYKKEGKEYFSRSLEGKYSNIDIYEKLNIEEKDRLKDFQMYIDN